MKRNRGKERHKPEHYENPAGAGAAIDLVEIGNATDVNERDPGDERPGSQQLNSSLRPLIEQQQGSAGGKQSSHKFIRARRLDLCT